MYKRVFGIIIILHIVLIAVLHNIATTYFIYWRIGYSDMIMHLLAGSWIALSSYWVLRFYKKPSFELTKKRLTVTAFSLVIGIGIFWEIFEFVNGVAVYSSKYIPDTITDMIMNILGGAIGLAIIRFYQLKIDNENVS